MQARLNRLARTAARGTVPDVMEALVPAAAACGVALAVFAATRPHLRRRPAARAEPPSVELSLNPRTGEPSAAPQTAPSDVDLTGPVPVTRLLTRPLERLPLLEPGTGAPTHVPDHPPALLLDPLRRTELIGKAWAARDVESLAAQAQADAGSRLACLVLAGLAGRQLGDPRSEHWLYQAFLTGADPGTDALLGPFRRELKFACDVPAWGVAAHWPATREGLGVSVAAEELRTGDSDAAYGILLDLPNSAPVSALRAAVAVDLHWWSRAVRVSQSAGGAWEALARTARATALVRKGRAQDAVAELDWVVERLDEDALAHERTGGQTLLARALFERAAAHRECGNLDDAWADLTRLIAASPTYPGAVAALKAL